MSGEAGSTVGNVAEAAITEAVARVEGAVLAADTSTEAVLEHAAERVAAAAATAQAIGDAALTTEIGRNVADVQEELDEWESEVQAALQRLEGLIQAQQSQITQLLTEVAELKAKTTVVVIPPAAPLAGAPSTLPGSTEPLGAVVVDPSGSNVSTPLAPASPPPKPVNWI